VVIAGVYLAAGPYMRTVGADEATVAAGVQYLYWFAPGLGLQFAMIAMFATLRGTGIVKPTMFLQMITVFVNVILAPVLIVGWGTGKPMGAAGAGLASTIAVIVGVILSAWYFHKHEKYVAVHREQLRFKPEVWGRLLYIGLPVGLEFFLMSVVMAVIYWVIRDFGAAAQAGFGVGQGVMRIIMLPAMAVAFASAPIAGQNFGARQPARVRETFKWTVIISMIVMFLLTVLCQFESDWFMRVFTTEAAVVEVGALFLIISSWNFAANAVIFSCSSMFQAMGNTWPTILSSAIRLVMFIVPVLWLSTQPGFELRDLWYVSVTTMFLQAAVSYALLRREFARRLAPLVAPAAAVPG
jgi:putative MATE family efflux protein